MDSGANNNNKNKQTNKSQINDKSNSKYELETNKLDTNNKLIKKSNNTY